MNPRIEINPAICHGQPVIRGTRVTVSQLLGSLSGRDSFQTVMEDYPAITADDLAAATRHTMGCAMVTDSNTPRFLSPRQEV
jgi:uncharacterized protein (DUF433 family)